MAKIYWYAPFDNADELSIATALAAITDHDLTVQSCSSRFGRELDRDAPGRFRLIRDLPPPAGENGSGRSVRDRAKVAFDRASLRQRVVADGGFDLVHLHTFNIFTDWFALRRLHGRAPSLIQSVHNVRPHESTVPRSVETQLLRAGYRVCDHLLVAHQTLKAQLVHDFGVPDARVRVVPLPIRSDVFSRVGARADSADHRGAEFLFFGTMRRNKGIPVLLDAIAGFDGDDVRFTFAGRGDAELEEMIRVARRRDPRIEAEIGYVDGDRRRELYERADAVLLPYTEFDAQSGVLQDAYAASTPVIASDLGALGAAVRDDGTGWLVPPGDPIALAGVLREAADSSSERRTRGEAAARIAEHRSPVAIAEMLAELYAEAMRSTR